MRGLVRKTILAAAIAGSGIFLAVGAQAHDDDHWRDEHWRREHRHFEEHERWRHEPPRRVVYERAPVYQRAPVIVQPAPIMMAPAYPQAVDPSLNFNFTIPLR